MGDRRLRRPATVLVVASVAPLAVVSYGVVRDGPGFAMGTGGRGVAVLLAAGLAPALAGLLHLWRRPEWAFGSALLGLVGAAWLVGEWDNPGASSDLVFTTGLVLWTTGPVALAHCALAYPTGRVREWPARVVLAAGYAVAVGLQGLATAVAFDPRAEGCPACPENVLALAADPLRHQQLDRWGVRLGAAWAVAAVLVVAVRLVRDSPARRRSTGLVLGASAAGLAAVAAYHARNLGRGYLGSELADRQLWTVQGLAVVGVAVAVVVDLARQRRAHRALTGMVVDLSSSAGLEAMLAHRLGDPGVRLCFPTEVGSRVSSYVDARGRPVDPVSLPGRRTELEHVGRHLATVVHRPGVLQDQGEVTALVSAIHLGLDHERLQALSLSQLADLRDSGCRLLDLGDTERRALERDLHDGAQQRLVGLLLGMRLLRSRGGQGEAVDLAEQELQQAVAGLRALGRGLYPVLLDDAGLGPALVALAETRDLRVDAVPDERFSRAVETTAYLVVVRCCAAGPAAVTMQADADGLRVRLTGAVDRSGLDEVADRVTTLGGTCDVSGEGAGRRVDVWLPR